MYVGFGDKEKIYTEDVLRDMEVSEWYRAREISSLLDGELSPQELGSNVLKGMVEKGLLNSRRVSKKDEIKEYQLSIEGHRRKLELE